jgi:hypothetical protein
MKKTGAKVLLHPRDLLRRGRLTNAKFRGCLAEGAQIHHASEQSKRLYAVHEVVL